MLEIRGDPEGDDDIKVAPGTESTEFIVYDHGVPTTIYCPASKIVVATGGGNDRIEVTTHMPTFLHGGAGRDTIISGNGPDFVTGGKHREPPGIGDPPPGFDGDSDHIETDGGVDTVWGDDLDFIDAGNDDDEINIMSEADGGGGKVNGGNGNDTVFFSQATGPVQLSNDGVADDGQAGGYTNIDIDVENIVGGPYNDTITGNSLNNVLIGGAGDDTLFGLDGNDTLDGGLGADVFSGGTGLDTADYSSRTAPVNVSLNAGGDDGESGEGDSVSGNVENVSGGSGNDTLTGNAAINLLSGNNGNDSLAGQGQNDTLFGNAGDDTLDGGTGADYLYGDDGNDNLDGGDNPAGIADILHGGNGNDNLDGGAGQDSLYGDGGSDTLRGGSADGAADWFVANDGQHDVLYMDQWSGDNGVWDSIDDTLPG